MNVRTIITNKIIVVRFDILSYNKSPMVSYVVDVVSGADVTGCEVIKEYDMCDFLRNVCLVSLTEREFCLTFVSSHDVM